MKYWVFQNNQVTGPYDNEDLTQVPGYSAETLVCPEGRRGTSMGDWQRASMVPELSLSIIKAGQLAVALRGSGGYGSLPPEPTLKDLAALGSLQEKVSLLDNTVGHLQESLRLKEEELLSVHKELDDKARHAQELAVQLGGLEERFSAVNALQVGLDKAVEAEHDVESTVQKQSQLIEDLGSQLQTLRDEQRQMEELRQELGRLKTEQQRQQEDTSRRLAEASAAAEEAGRKAASAAEEAALKAAAAPQPMPGLRPDRPGLPSAVPGGGLGLPSDLPSERLGLPSERLGLPSERPSGLSPLMDPPNIAPAPFSIDAAPASLGAGDMQPPLGQFGGSASLDPLGGAPLPSMPPAASGAPGGNLASVVPDAPAETPKKNLKPLILVGVAVIAVVAFGALKLGLLGGKKRAAPDAMPSAPMADRTPLPTPPAPVETPKQLTPEELAEQQKHDAIDLVKGWPLPDGGSVGAKLETGAPQPSGAPPWMADKGKTGIFQVNFYAPKTADAAAQTYEFEVSLADKKVAAHNATAAALLSGRPAVAQGKKSGKSRTAKPKIKPKPDASEDKPMLEDLLNISEEPTSAKPQQVSAKSRKPKAVKPAKAAAESAGAGDIMIDGSGDTGAQAAAPAAPKAVRKAKRPVEKRNVDRELNDLLADGEEKPKKPSAMPAKQDSLDDLLEPSSAAKPADSAPQAEPAMPAGGDAADSSLPSDDNAAEAPAPKKASQSAAKPVKKKAQAADAELLDDLLKP